MSSRRCSKIAYKAQSYETIGLFTGMQHQQRKGTIAWVHFFKYRLRWQYRLIKCLEMLCDGSIVPYSGSNPLFSTVYYLSVRGSLCLTIMSSLCPTSPRRLVNGFLKIPLAPLNWSGLLLIVGPPRLCVWRGTIVNGDGSLESVLVKKESKRLNRGRLAWPTLSRLEFLQCFLSEFSCHQYAWSRDINKDVIACAIFLFNLE